MAAKRKYPSPPDGLPAVPAKPEGGSVRLRPTPDPFETLPAGETGFEPVGAPPSWEDPPGLLPPSRSEHTNEWRFDGSETLPPASAADIIGQRYRIIDNLAAGGMAQVFRVRHLQLQKIFALKIIHDDISADPKMEKLFVREGRVLSRLDHPNIVQVTDLGQDPRFGAYLVMEFLRGESLFESMKRKGRLPVGVSLRIAEQVAGALSYMHDQGLIHCDIKPENLFLCRTTRQEGLGRPRIKLIDFGLARDALYGGRLAPSEVAGTPLYAAPEQLGGQGPMPSMDIYAVGTLLCEMITGRLPFEGSPAMIVTNKLSRDPPPVRYLTEAPLDPDLEAVIDGAIHPNPSKRPGTMDILADGIRTLLRRVDAEAAPPTKSAQAPAIDRLGNLSSAHRLPLFVVNRAGRLTAASETFRQMVAAPKEVVLGKRLSETRLGNIYKKIDEDVAKTLQSRQELQRRMRFRTDDGTRAEVLLWLIPTGSTKAPEISGILVPLARPVGR